MIPRVSDFVHIRGEQEDLYHLVMSVNLDSCYASCLQENSTPLDQREIIVRFCDIDDIKCI